MSEYPKSIVDVEGSVHPVDPTVAVDAAGWTPSGVGRHVMARESREEDS